MKKTPTLSELTDAEIGRLIRAYYERCRSESTRICTLSLSENLPDRMKAAESMARWRSDQTQNTDSIGAWQALNVLIEEPLTWKYAPGSGRTESIRTFTREDLPNLPEGVRGLFAVPKTMREYAETVLYDYFEREVETEDYMIYEFSDAMFEGSSIEDGTVDVIAEQMEYEYCRALRDAADWLMCSASGSMSLNAALGWMLRERHAQLQLPGEPPYVQHRPDAENIRGAMEWLFQRNDTFLRAWDLHGCADVWVATAFLQHLTNGQMWTTGMAERMDLPDPPVFLQDFGILQSDERVVILYGDAYKRRVGQ